MCDDGFTIIMTATPLYTHKNKVQWLATICYKHAKYVKGVIQHLRGVIN